MNTVRTPWPARSALAAVVCSLSVGTALAAEPAATAAGSGTSATPAAAATASPAKIADPEESLDEGLKSFGYLSGLARGCVVPEQRTKLEREALDLSAAIARLFGTDRAFLYAAGFGYGTSVVVDVDHCREVLDRYDARVARFRAQRGADR